MSKQPGGSEPVVPAEVSDLIEESQTVQSWIERLAEHSSDVRADVFERVLTDYQNRLGKVTGALAKYRSDLVSGLDGRQAQVASLQADRDSHAADLEEARLRHAVGEYSEGTWDDRRESIEASLHEIDELLDAEQGAVAELTAIIDSIEKGHAPPASGSPPAETAEMPSDTTVELAEAEESFEPEKAVEEDGETGEDVIESVTEASPVPPADRVDGDPGAAGDYMDELEFLESLSLDESEKFDAMSAMLDDEESGKKDA